MSLGYSLLKSPLNENLYNVYAQSFLGNLTLDEFLKTVYFCRSYGHRSSVLLCDSISG